MSIVQCGYGPEPNNSGIPAPVAEVVLPERPNRSDMLIHWISADKAEAHFTLLETKLREAIAQRGEARKVTEQLRVQLAGCGVAATGWGTGDNRAVKGDYGWSPAYEDTLKLREHSWRCFHCGFFTLDENKAAAHFGDRDDAEEFKPICKWWQRMDDGERAETLQDTIQQLNAANEATEVAEAALATERERVLQDLKRLWRVSWTLKNSDSETSTDFTSEDNAIGWRDGLLEAGARNVVLMELAIVHIQK